MHRQLHSFCDNPIDPSLLPKRTQPPRGTALLWQPEIVFPYLALLEKYTSTPDLMEAAAGALQNLTACSWKVSYTILVSVYLLGLLKSGILMEPLVHVHVYVSACNVHHTTYIIIICIYVY